MKLIPARCPSCGADIEVNKENETTKCKYCDTRIIIDDAIAKYKVELSGKVTVENLPTVINLIKLGTRHLDKNEYEPAQEKFAKALELDADNSELIVKDALARVAQKEIVEASLNRLLSSIKDAKEYCKEKELEEYVMYCVEHLDHKRVQVIPVLQSEPQREIFFNLKQKLFTYLNFYERVLRNHLIKDENKAIVIRKIFACIQNYRDNNKYKVYDVQSGTFYTNTYKIPNDMKEYLEYKEYQYQDELAKVDPEYNSKLQQQRLLEAQELERLRKEREEKERKRKALIKKIFGDGITKIINIIDACISGFLILVSLFMILMCLTKNGILSGITIFVALLFCVPNIALRFIPFYKKAPAVITIIVSVARYCIILLLLLLSIIILPEPGFVNQKFTSISEDEIIEISQNKIKISTYDYQSERWINETYSYEYKSEGNNKYLITIDKDMDMVAEDIRFRYWEDDQDFCKLNYSDNCTRYFNIIKDAE